jgi:peroxiredoxin
MSRMRIIGVAALAAIVLFIFFAIFLRGGAPPGPAPTDAVRAPVTGETLPGSGIDVEARMAPDFVLPTMSGEPFHLAGHRGQVLVLNFWATWCAPCRIEIPEFIEIQDELGDEGVQFLGISMDEEGFEVVRPFAEEMEINYPLVIDVGEIAEMYGGIYALPTTIIVDREGYIRHKVPGMLTRSSLLPIIEALL